MGASSFTVQVPGGLLTYQSPNLTSLNPQSAFPDYSGGHATATAFLVLASELSVTGVKGNDYDLHGDVQGSPAVLESLINDSQQQAKSSTCKEYNTSCGFLTNTYWQLKGPTPVSAQVTVVDGYVVSETFELRGFSQPGFSDAGTVRYSKINASHV